MPDGVTIPGGPGFSGAPTGTVPGGPDFSGNPQPPEVPCDPVGDAWRGPPGPPGAPGADSTVPGPPGATGPAGPTYTLPTASTTVLGGVKVDGSTVTISSGVISAAAAAAGVASFNTRTGAVVLSGADVTTALTFTPYNATNPAGYQTAAQVTTTLGPYALTSAVPIASSTTPIMDSAAAIGTGTTWARADHVHPTDTSRYAAANPSGYQTAANVTTALAAGQPGAFSTLSASGVVSGAGFTTLLAPYQSSAQVVAAIAAGNPGAFSTLSASSTVSGTGFSTYLASPPAIGGTAPSTGKFTTVQSTVVTGTAPLIVASTTNVANLNASSLNGATFAAPGAIGGTTAAAGAFTTLSATSTSTLAAMTSTGITASPISGSTGSFTTLAASSTVSGVGFSTYLASPPAIGGTASAAGAFTTLAASSTVSGTGFSTYLASPPGIGGTAAAAGSFTTLAASSTVSGTGFSTYLASPPAIGGTTAAAGAFSTLSASSTVSGTGFTNRFAAPGPIGNTTASTGAFTSLTSTGGLNFGSTFASGQSDLSKHVALYGAAAGFNITSDSSTNYVAAGAHMFWTGTTRLGYMNTAVWNVDVGLAATGGMNSTTIGATTPAAGTFTNLTATGAQALPLSSTAKGGTSYSVATTDCSMVIAPTGTFTLTLPTAASSTGRILRLKLTAAFAVNSASSNIVQLVGGAATAAIMPATSGKYCELQSDGANWQIMIAN